MASVKALRDTGDEGCQWVDVHYTEDFPGRLRITGVGPVIPGSEYATSDLRGMVGRTFESSRELNLALNGSDSVLGDIGAESPKQRPAICGGTL